MDLKKYTPSNNTINKHIILIFATQNLKFFVLIDAFVIAGNCNIYSYI